MKIAIFLLLTAGVAVAGEPAPELPAADAVARVLRETPAVRAAAAQLRAEEANRRRLAAGSHEWSLRLGAQQRKVLPGNAPDERHGEWNAALERPLRLPGKGTLDAELGAAGVAVATTGLGDARHETARALLAGWFAWLRESAAARQWQRQVELLGAQDRANERRRQLGDAARLDTVQTAGAKAQAAAQLVQAEARRRIAEEELRRRFPGLPLAEPTVIGEPPPLAGSFDEWVAAIVEHNHELGVAEGETRRARLAAERARSERRPDPTFGVQFASERSGEEKLLAAYVSIPLPGGARSATADAALAEADARDEAAAAIRRKIAGEAAALYHAAAAAGPGWQAARDAAEHLTRSAEMTARAYQLGEGSLLEVLAARRLAHEAELAASQARLTALELYYRLQVDSHRLWDFDEE